MVFTLDLSDFVAARHWFSQTLACSIFDYGSFSVKDEDILEDWMMQSIFEDVYKSRRYKWANLSVELFF